LEIDFSEIGDTANKEGWIFARKDPIKSAWLLGLVVKIDMKEKNNFEANLRKMEKYLPLKMKGLYFEPMPPSLEQVAIFRKSSDIDPRNRFYNLKNDPLGRSLEYAFINKGSGYFLCIATSKETMENLIKIIEGSINQ